MYQNQYSGQTHNIKPANRLYKNVAKFKYLEQIKILFVSKFKWSLNSSSRGIICSH